MCRKLDLATGRVSIASHTYTQGVEIEFMGCTDRRALNVCVNPQQGGGICGHVLEHDVTLPALVERHRGRIARLTGDKAILDLFGGPIGDDLCLYGRTMSRHARHNFSGRVEVALNGQDPVVLEICLNPKGDGVCGAIKGTTMFVPGWYEQVHDQVARLEGSLETLAHFGLKPIKARRTATRLVPSTK